MRLQNILQNLPEVKGPKEKKLSFNKKLKWTVTILIIFFILANIPLYGLAEAALRQFEYLAVIMGTEFGSIISLGIGPIVMASIILQLLVGSNIINIDTSTEEGKKYFQGIQKLMVLFFIIFEAMVYVLMKGIQAHPGYTSIVIFQLILGGLAILFMDEVIQKYGFGSGVSLFIAAGVSWRLFVGVFGVLTETGLGWPIGPGDPIGKVWIVIKSLIEQNPQGALAALAVLVATVIVFLMVVFAQSLKVEIPLSFSRLKGYGMKWPLKFFYASVIPVILTSALEANIQLFGGLLQGWLGRPTLLGNFVDGRAICAADGCGLAYWLSPFDLLGNVIRGSLQTIFIPRAITHILFYMIVAAVFSVFWVKTSGMDSRSQAEKIMNSGLQIPGFRKDERVLESVLSRYIMPLTVMGGLAIGLLAAGANLFGALTGGTSILLAVMILYQLYEEIAKQHAMDMHPALKKIIGG